MKKLFLTSVAALSVLSASAAAQTNGSLVLACRGEVDAWSNVTNERKKEPISFGIFVNFAAQTVEGFADQEPVKITAITQTVIEFRISLLTGGTIDRVTGDTWAQFSTQFGSQSYSLICRPTQRMF